MNKRYVFTLISTVISSSISFLSCVTPTALYVHMPDKVNSPGFYEAKEVKLDLNADMQLGSNNSRIPVTTSIDAAYSPVNHLGILASWRGISNYGTTNTINNGLSSYNPEVQTFNLNSSAFDIGIGYFSALDERTRFEMYAGYGSGYISNNNANSSDPGPYNVKYHRFFQQTDIDLGTKRLLFMWGYRIMVKKYNNFQYNPSLSLIDSFPVNQLMDGTFVFLQPYFEMQTGYKYVRLNIQAGCQFKMSGPAEKDNTSNISYIYYQPLAYFSVGFTFHYAPRFVNDVRL